MTAAIALRYWRHSMHIQALMHVPFEGPAGIADWAMARGHTLALTPLFAGAPLPELAIFDWLVVLGGPMGANDEAEFAWLAAEKRLLAAAIATGKTVIGICLGAQLLATALGARVKRNANKEIGWFPLELTAAGKISPLVNDLTPDLLVFHWHGDTFALPPGAVQLARSAACEQQIFLYGERVLGLQCHLESTAESVAAIVAQCANELVPDVPFIQTPTQLLTADAAAYRALQQALFNLLDQLDLTD
jgi:GMP synthase-like glutamine amidotransferase